MARVDADPKGKDGDLALVGPAIELHPVTKKRRQTDDEIRRAYAGQADAMIEEIADLVGIQYRIEP